MCALNEDTCSADDLIVATMSSAFLRPVVCARLINPSGTPMEYGFYVFEDACLAYEELYPALVECRGEDWRIVE